APSRRRRVLDLFPAALRGGERGNDHFERRRAARAWPPHRQRSNMSLWIALTLMVALAVCGLSVPLVLDGSSRRRDSTLGVLRTQLVDISAQRAAGLLSPEEADGLGTEIKRRILTEARTQELPARPFDPRLRP